jgi:hypothetical protein
MRGFARRDTAQGAEPPSPSSPSSQAAQSPASAPDPALLAERERLTERFTIMQTELGGLFYEMAIRDHVRIEILMRKAAALQRLDAELAQVEYLLAGRDDGIGGRCPACGAVHARGAAFCSQCAKSLG